jgi:hypothetical protein
MAKPACVPCQRFFRPKKTGFAWIEGMPKIANAKPGTDQPEWWQPYKLWHSDMYECEGCGAQIIVGHASQPLANRHDPEFDRLVDSFGATVQINDC